MRELARFDPVVLFLYFAAELSLSVFAQDPVFGALSLLGGACFLFICRRGGARGALFYVLLFVLVTVTNPIFSHGGVTPLFFVNGSAVTLESVAYGAGLAVGIVSVLLWCACWSEVMTDDKFIYIFGRRAPKLSLTLSLALRMIPRFIRRMRAVEAAQRSLGAYSSRSFSDRAGQYMRVFYAMTGWSAESAINTASAMRARGYGLPGRTVYRSFTHRPADRALAAAAIALAAGALVGIGAGATGMSYYPRLTGIKTSPTSIFAYACFGALSFLPCIIEAGGALRWSYCKLKI